MTKLAAWSFDLQHSDSGPEAAPQRAGHAGIGLEQHLEDWIVNDVTLIAEGLTLVGRQVTIDDGRLDLLALDSQDRWVVVEVKPGMLDSGALHQAIYYASSLARLDADELYGKLEANLGKLGDEDKLAARLKQQLSNESEEREIALLLVGAGTHSGLERVNKFLSRFDLPISVVSFEVFELDGGRKLLVREVVDEPIKTTAPRRRYTVEAIRGLAADVGVRDQFDRFVSMSEEAGLPVQPQRASVRIAPPANRTRFLMYAAPRAGPNGGELGIWVGPRPFAEWFPHIDEEEATAALGKHEDGAYLAGEELEKRLDQIAVFLRQYFPQPDGDET